MYGFHYVKHQSFVKVSLNNADLPMLTHYNTELLKSTLNSSKTTVSIRKLSSSSWQIQVFKNSNVSVRTKILSFSTNAGTYSL